MDGSMQDSDLQLGSHSVPGVFPTAFSGDAG